jgi:hypothetical protein
VGVRDGGLVFLCEPAHDQQYGRGLMRTPQPER